MREVADGVILTCFVKTCSKAQGVVYEDGILNISVLSSPVENRANREVVEVLSEYVGVKKKQVEIVSGDRSRTKQVLIREATLEEIDKIRRELSGQER